VEKMSHFTVFKLTIAFVVSLSVFATPRCTAQVLQEGYCGNAAATACARDLGIQWKQTTATTRLASEKFVSFRDVVEAMQSLGLHVFPCSVDASNIAAIREIYKRNKSHVSGIAWLNTVKDETQNSSSQGHFVVAAIRREDDSVTYYDADTNVISILQINNDKYLPSDSR